MRKVLVSLIVLSLLPALAAAAVTNPEGFEDYTLTTDWSPTTAGEGWKFDRMYGAGAAVASIVADGGGKVLEIDSAAAEGAEYGFEGTPMWDCDGVPDADYAVTKSGFDIKPIGGANGSEFVAKFLRHSEADLWYHGTWQVGIRVGHWSGFGEPYGPIVEGTDWDAAGTLVFLETWVGPGEVYINTPIPGFGEGVYIVPGIPVAPPETTSEWWRIEIEEDNVTQQTRARMYLRGGTPSAWTDWQDHNADVTYAGTEGQVFGRLGGDMQLDNFYITGEGGVPAGNPGDANNDSVVSADDYGSVQLHFGDTGAVNILGDANLDGVVSADDYGSVQLHFGTSYGGGATIPEPGTMLLLTIGGLGMLRRRRK